MPTLTSSGDTGAPKSRPPLRVNNVAKRLDLRERMVRHLALLHKIPAFKIDGKSWGFWPDEVERFKRAREAGL